MKANRQPLEIGQLKLLPNPASRTTHTLMRPGGAPAPESHAMHMQHCGMSRRPLCRGPGNLFMILPWKLNLAQMVRAGEGEQGQFHGLAHRKEVLWGQI
jgi:hypothetical protein